MSCPNCQFDNPAGAKFCMNCGTNLQHGRCSNCQTELPSGARFCFECGQPTSTQSTADHQRHLRLATRAPEDLTQKMLSPGRPLGERRVVTSLFADVVGSTAIAEQLDPEEWTAIMNGAFQRITKTIYAYEGTIARLMGDALLAFFGAPVSHEDDPERAVRAGLDLIEAVGQFSEETEAPPEIKFQMRVGINTGEVVVGAVGSDLVYEYTAMGDSVNLAARMEQTAQPGSVQISEQTYRLVAPLFEVEPLDPIQVKGKREPVNAYVVTGLKASPDRTRGIEGLHSPIVGRKRELAAIESLIDQTLGGRGQVVTIVGEAGLGKSRLLEELISAWNARTELENDWVQYRGVSYETERPYGIFRRSLLEQFNVGAEEPAEAIQARTIDRMQPESYQKSVLAMRALLRLESDENGASSSSGNGEEFKNTIHEGILSPMRTQLQAHPALFIFDDLHWADPASVELAENMLQFADEDPALLIFATRPERRAPGWRLIQLAEREYGHRHTIFELRPLTDEDANRLVSNLLEVPEMPSAIRNLIRRKAEGNPFFIEEIIRTLIERGFVLQENGRARWSAGQKTGAIQIPENVNALLTARIDRLQPEVRKTLQMASVIGRQFSTELLRALTNNGADLNRHLIAFERLGLVLPTSSPKDYSFRHDLTREAAYNSILRRQRRLLHRLVGEAIEELYSAQLIDQAPILARHFKEAGDGRRCRKYALLAGDEAARVHATEEAILFYQQALDHGQNLELAIDEQSPVYEKLGRSLELASRFEDAFLLYDELDKLAMEQNHDGIRLTALLDKATLRVIANTFYDPVEGQRLLAEAGELADKLDDQRSRAKILWQLLLLDLSTDMDVKARLKYGQEALVLAREQEMDELIPFILHDLWYAYAGSGQWDTAIEALEEACRLWRDTENDPMLSESLLRLSLCFQSRGDFDTAIQFAEEAFQTALRSDNADQKAISRSLIGEVYFERGDYIQAMQIMQETIDYGILVTNVTACIGTRSDLALVYLELNRPEESRALLDAANNLASDFFLLQPWVHGAQIEYLLAIGELNRASEMTEHLISSSEQKRRLGSMTPLWIRPGLAHVKVALAKEEFRRAATIADALIAELQGDGLHLFLAEALYLKGLALFKDPSVSQDSARSALFSAREEAEGFAINRILWKVLLALSEVEERAGDHEAAEGYRRKAVEVKPADPG